MTGITYALFLLVCVATLADAITTVLVLQRGGSERNPLLRWAMARLSPAIALLVWKTAQLYVLDLLVEELVRRSDGRVALWLLAGIAVAFAALTALNLRNLRRLSGR